MVCSPSLHGLKDPALVSKGPHRGVTSRIDDIVCIARAVAEIVLSTRPLMHPGRLEESPVVVIGVDGLPVTIINHELMNTSVERFHIIAQLRNSWHESCFITRSLHRLISICIELSRSPALQLPTPNTSNVKISLTIIVHQHSRIDAVASRDGFSFGLKRAFRLVTLRNPNPENPLLVPSRDIEVILPILIPAVRRPKLLRSLGDIFNAKGLAVDRSLPTYLIHRQHMMVHHVVLTTIVVVRDIGPAVVGGVYVEFVVEDSS